jgi:acetolactate synthase-1/2/3 large subunit
VKFRAPAVWVVLNDARYGMCEQGMAALGMVADAAFPEVDFAALARAQGAGGVRVETERDLEGALEQAMAAAGPFVVDVRIDPSRMAPTGARNRCLRAQIQGAAGAGAAPPAREAAFPARAS